MHFMSSGILYLCWIWITFTTVIQGADESRLPTKKCTYYRLTMYMDCSNLNLGEILPNTYPVNESRIKDFLLHHNGLRRLEYNVFHNLPNLLSLDLSDNLLSSLDFRLFTKAPQLKTLNLRNNRLTNLGDERLFVFQRSLTSLILDFNRLKYINESLLKPLVSLETLYLFGNILVCNCDLKKTVLWCESKGIDAGAVCDSPHIYSNFSWTILNKQDCNKTENIPTTKIELFDSRCKYDNLTKSLDCTGVPLKSINKNKFPSNLSLESLILQDTSIHTLESDVFNDLGSLRLLDLSRNFLENLNQQEFSKLDQLITLNLSHNKILSLSKDIFLTQKQLRVLKLNNNHLSHVAKESLSPLVSLQHLDFSNNRFVCDCELSEAMQWCKERNLSTGATCAFPRQFSGLSWSILQNNSDCIQPTTQVDTTSTNSAHQTSFNTIILISLTIMTILLLLSVIAGLWYFCKRQKKDDIIYDDIQLEDRIANNYLYDVLEELKEKSFNSEAFMKPCNSSNFDEHGATGTTNENTYEDIETVKMRNKDWASQEDVKKNLDLKEGKSVENNPRNTASYMDMSGASNRPRTENPYVLK